MRLPFNHPHAVVAACAIVTVAAVSLALTTRADGAVRRVHAAEGAVALTFDDGPDPNSTPAVLDALRDAGATATFFVVGEQVERSPEIVARMVSEGHEVAHHTHTHPRLDRTSPDRFAEEMARALKAIDEAGAVRPVWYRPPRGYRHAGFEAMAERRGLKVAMWARCFEKGEYHSAREMAEEMARATRDGDIVLAHDGFGDRTMTVEALPLYLDAMAERGIEVVTLSELTRGASD